MQNNYDVIVIGGGHAGTEAAAAAARLGVKTLLLTQNIETVGQMSCNPAIGGIGKSHLVKEIDALDGIMAKAADKAGIHFRVLNSRKGPAVRATRAQADRQLYRKTIREMLESHENLQLFQQSVDDLIVENDKIVGVVTQIGLKFFAKSVVLTVGTFLGGKIHIGQDQHGGGRAGDAPSNALSTRLRSYPFRIGRLKTGTPPRIDGRTVDYSGLDSQPGDKPLPVFSFLGRADQHPRQVHCHITHTNEKTHKIIQDNINLSAMYSGNIAGVGPRYCPSIEDKISRFADKNSHQIFIEPEGLSTHELYPNGISTSLPYNVQEQFIHSIKGFENAHITRPGYAIEYDYFDPRDLQPSLETKVISGLFFAGQINGTTGYEEAGAQGLIAGLNAANKAAGQPAWYPKRNEAYIGVLIDDLVTQGTLEPYRMFTSRAEYRLLLREDNADMRLTEKGRELGLVGDERWQFFAKKRGQIETLTASLKKHFVHADTKLADKLEVLTTKLTKESNLFDLLRRPEVTLEALLNTTKGEFDCTVEAGVNQELAQQIIKQVEINTKYEGYIERQTLEIARKSKNEDLCLPEALDYKSVSGLSNEVVEKLKTHQPETLGIASRIPGVTPAAISLLLVHLKKRQLEALV